MDLNSFRHHKKVSIDAGENNKLHPFRTPTGYKPDLVCGSLENYIDKNKLEISSMPIKHHYQDNITSQERAALASLKKQPAYCH